jgi:hypothetical protein
MADNPESRLSNDTNIKIDTSIENLKTLYPVQGVYKARQKSNNGRLLPFETIDKSIYKKQSNCVCFITSEKRIHAWIKAAVQTLFLDLGSKSNFDVTWRDLKDKSSITVQTEFIVYDRSIKTENDDDFLYKLIFYLSTGKIMIQGKGYELFCDNIFEQCLSLVNEYLTTSVKTDEVNPDIVTTHCTSN